ncbi:murein biosynthesis integral membrane protein MurJ [Phenylobacterium sp.]|uniref:murein biosynthesis integral membrane protein MurJ n=1 Tax=Phenylobacterium sp. TaxID=1871053 RepID=UPI0035AFBB44
MIRSSMVYSAFTLLSRVFGFVRDLAVTYRMGASATFAADAFNTAFAFPNLFRRIFAEGAFAAAFVPAYSKSLATDGEETADVLAADAMAVLAAATLAITVVAELTMPWLMYLIAPGFAANPDKFKLAIVLTQITMPYLPCMAIYAHLSGVLNGRNRFILSAAAPILLNLWTLATVLPAKTPVGAAYAASIGVVAAGISQAALLWWGVRKSGARVDLRWPRLTPDIKRLISLAIPGAIAASASQINVFISGILVSQVNGARSWLAVCDRLYQLPQGLVGVAVGVALLPRLSRAVHAGDKAQSSGAIDEAVTFSMALTLPAAAALIAMPFFLIDGLYTRGAFTAVDAHQTAAALFYYGWGVPAFVLAQLASRVFFASQDTKTPMRYALVSVGANIAGGVTLFPLMGAAGIAAATSFASWLNVVMMTVAILRRGLWTPDAKAISRLVRILAAAALLAALLGAASHFRPLIEAPLAAVRLGPLGAKEIAVVGVSALAAVAYPFILFAFGGLTLAEARAALRRKKGETAPVDPGLS